MKNLKQIVSNALGCNEIDLERNDASSNTISQWDSFGMLQIILALEKEYKIQFTHSEMLHLSNLQNIENIIMEKLNGK